MQDFLTPKADPELYGISFVFVYIAFLVPIPFFFLDLCIGNAEWFHRSGAITLFIIAFVQFKQLSLLQNKHIKNAERAKNQEPIYLLSEEYKKLEGKIFWAGLYGTAVLAYGDKLMEMLITSI
jgi:hypothetical protein